MQWRRPNVSLPDVVYTSFREIMDVCNRYHRLLVGGEIDFHCLYVTLFHLKKISGPYNNMKIAILVWLAIVNVGVVSPVFSMVSNCFPGKESGKLLTSILKKLDYRIERFQYIESVTLEDVESMWNE